MSGKDEVNEALSLDDGGEVRTLNLKSKDGKTIGVDANHAKISGLIKTALDGDSHETEVPVDVRYDVLELIVNYMARHQGEEPAIIEKPLKS